MDPSKEKTELAVFDGFAHRAEDAVRKLWKRQSPSYTLPLFHYTSGHALKSIVEGGRLWATHIAYLNDTSELAYGSRILSSEVERRLKAEPSAAFRIFLDEVSWFFTSEHYRAITQGLYVTCFCENGDLLSQWRGYGNGYALGFHHGILRDACAAILATKRGPSQIKYELVAMIYEPSEQAKLIAASLDEAQRTIDDYVAANPGTMLDAVVATALHAIESALTWAFISMKDPGFSEEKEWRLVYSLGSQRDCVDAGLVKLRATDSHLVPYLDVELQAQAGLSRLPLEQLIVGPTTTPELAESAARALLRSAGYECLVERSAIPFR